MKMVRRFWFSVGKFMRKDKIASDAGLYKPFLEQRLRDELG